MHSGEILQKIQKLNVLGTVLYIAAHPDDENTRLLAYLANDALYNTAYLSLTRGDGGQNLIGDEQGIDLGLIRTQELLAARKIDGAQQYFSRAYDFGFSKSTDEALAFWGKDEILADAVLLIRKLRPDIIITRFPPDSRAGHGHHSASAVIAREAWKLAGEASAFPEQIYPGTTAWQPLRVLWNTFNFGSLNTQNDQQFTLNAGGFNPLLGKSYGEIAAISRSQHRSQGFGSAGQRGEALEYFETLEGIPPVHHLFDGVNTTWQRASTDGSDKWKAIQQAVEKIIHTFKPQQPAQSIPYLQTLYKQIEGAAYLDEFWKSAKLSEIRDLLMACAGIYAEAYSNIPTVAASDSLKLTFQVTNRSEAPIRFSASSPFDLEVDLLPADKTVQQTKTIKVPSSADPTQPYWMEYGLKSGRFSLPQSDNRPEGYPAFSSLVSFQFGDITVNKRVPVKYKYTDPVLGEVHQPLIITPILSVHQSPRFVLTNLDKQKTSHINIQVTALTTVPKTTLKLYQYEYKNGKLVQNLLLTDNAFETGPQQTKEYKVELSKITSRTKEKALQFMAVLDSNVTKAYQSYTIRTINYEHIPAIRYFYLNKVKLIDDEIKTAGKKIGYIVGAGDQVADALSLMGYEVTLLTEKDVLAGNLQQFDAIVAGIRAYNIHAWLNTANAALMKYVHDGGNYVVQYNTNNQLGRLLSDIGPYPFTISRNRVTDETAAVKFVDSNHELLNWPNKITSKDFDNWIQERGIYFADDIKPPYTTPFSMHDAGEDELTGSLISARYGKGRFTYTGLVFFRQLPAGVGGAFRIFANLVSNPNYKANGAKK